MVDILGKKDFHVEVVSEKRTEWNKIWEKNIPLEETETHCNWNGNKNRVEGENCQGWRVLEQENNRIWFVFLKKHYGSCT